MNGARLYGLLLLCLLPAAAYGQRAIAITHVTVIDGSSPTPRLDQTVVILGDRIVAVTASARAEIPARTQIVDGRGKFLVPGFWDMHVHTDAPGAREVIPLYARNGVTGVRDMGSHWDSIRTWRRDIAAGELDGPRIIASGPYLEGGETPVALILARTPDEGRAGVDSLVRLGVDLVKVHGRLSPETYFAIARQARAREIPFAGHVSRAVGAAAASDSGQRSIEHLLSVPLPCTRAESIALTPRFPVQSAIGRCSSAPLAPLYAKFVRNDTWMTPTLVAMVEVAAWPTSAVPGDSLAHYLPDTLRKFVAGIFPMPDSIPSGADSVGRAMLAKRLAQVAAMHRAGVGILLGTDAPLRNSPPGFGLHEEMLLMVRGGMTPYDVIRAATSESARFLGIADSVGTVAAGKLADLVLLDADPTADIRNTRQIAMVIANGRVLRRGLRGR